MRLEENAYPPPGHEVVDHRVHAADAELAASDATVTDRERMRRFERL